MMRIRGASRLAGEALARLLSDSTSNMSTQRVAVIPEGNYQPSPAAGGSCPRRAHAGGTTSACAGFQAILVRMLFPADRADTRAGTGIKPWPPRIYLSWDLVGDVPPDPRRGR